MKDDPEALALLREIRDELRAIREAIESERRPSRSLRHQDRAALLAILPVLYSAFPESLFSCWQVLDLAAGTDALGLNLRTALGGLTAPRLGKLLARAAGFTIEGFQIRRQGQDGNGALWRCVADASS